MRSHRRPLLHDSGDCLRTLVNSELLEEKGAQKLYLAEQEKWETPQESQGSGRSMRAQI